jgi:hypothetical protein
MLARVEDEDNPVPLVLACVAYALYKNEKRDWIKQQTEINGIRPTQPAIDFYVSTWSDIRIESNFTAANDVISQFVQTTVDTVKGDISDQVYQSRFRELIDLLQSQDRSNDGRYQSLTQHITSKTRTNWWTAIGQNIVGSLIYLAITVLVVAGVFFAPDLVAFAKKLVAWANS